MGAETETSGPTEEIPFQDEIKALADQYILSDQDEETGRRLVRKVIESMRQITTGEGPMRSCAAFQPASQLMAEKGLNSFEATAKLMKLFLQELRAMEQEEESRH